MVIGTLINVSTIVVGSLLGILLKRGIKKRIADTVMHGLGLCVLLIGLSGALKTQNTLLIILSMVFGGALGAAIGIEERITRLGAWAQMKLERKSSHVTGEQESTFAKGFVTASLVFCVGAMAVVGSLDSGIRGDHSTLVAKALLDGIAAVVFAGTFGIGVILSAVPVLLYQGSISLLGALVAPLLNEVVVMEMSAVGGLLIVGIGLNMIFEKNIKVANLLPSIFVPFIYYLVTMFWV